MPSRDAAGQQRRADGGLVPTTLWPGDLKERCGLAVCRVWRGGRQGPARLGVGAGIRWTALPPERGWEVSVCDGVGGDGPWEQEMGSTRQRGLKRRWSLTQGGWRALQQGCVPEPEGPRSCARWTRGCLQPAPSSLGLPTRVQASPGCPLAWSLAFRDGWGLGTRSQPDSPLHPAFLYSSEAGKGGSG